MLLTGEINRGYYMAAQRYEISLGVLKNICRHEKRNFVSPGIKSPHYKHANKDIFDDFPKITTGFISFFRNKFPGLFQDSD